MDDLKKKTMIIKEFDLDDIFIMSEILDLAEINVNTEKITKNSKVEKLEKVEDIKKLGKAIIFGVSMDLVTSLLKGMHKAKQPTKQLISNLTSLSIEEVSKMKYADIKQFFSELTQKEDFQDFFEQARDATGQQ